MSAGFGEGGLETGRSSLATRQQLSQPAIDHWATSGHCDRLGAAARASYTKPSSSRSYGASHLSCCPLARLLRLRCLTNTMLSRLTSVPSPWTQKASICVAYWLVLAGDIARYREFCDLLDAEPGPSTSGLQMERAFCNALAPRPSADHEKLVRTAKFATDAALATKDQAMSTWNLVGLSAIQLRAGSARDAVRNLREAIAHAPDGPPRALGAAWLALALARDGHLDLAQAWFDQADRYIQAQFGGIRPELDHVPPSRIKAVEWWPLFVAWREAQGLLLDGNFPANPFVRADRDQAAWTGRSARVVRAP